MCDSRYLRHKPPSWGGLAVLACEFSPGADFPFRELQGSCKLAAPFLRLFVKNVYR